MDYKAVVLKRPACVKSSPEARGAMKLTILGCGTSTGVPVPACTCAVCSALLQHPSGFNLLIDTSPDLRTQALRHNISHLDAVLYTHSHADHVLGLDDLRAFNFIHGRAIDCYASAATFASLERTFPYVFHLDPHYEGGLLPQIVKHEIAAGQTVSIGPFSVQALALKHGRGDVLGYRFGDIAYATDCNFLPPETFDALRGVRYLVLDGLRFEEHRTHFTIPQAIEVAAQIGAQTTYLTHTTHSVDYHEISATLPKGVSLAYDGLIIDDQN